jgi:tetratricopeptide (TPR) repeat protein
MTFEKVGRACARLARLSTVRVPVLVLAAAAGFATLNGCQRTDSAVAEPGSTGASLYDGVDRYHRPINTSSEEAQRWFDQGLQLLYGFNHDEAVRSFQEAAARDPETPLPWWGIAYAHGMNINDQEMTDERWKAAWEAVEQARQRLDGADPLEAALVNAVAQRYSWPPPEEQRTLDEAYAHAIEEVWKQYPDDPDVSVLFVEALMNLQPWDYWTDAGEPKGRIEEVVNILESVLAEQPDHPGAAHFYIHAVEASQDPDRAIEVANMLRDRIPGAGHLVHMPSHIYVRVGRYADSADANVEAIAADRAYLKVAPEPSLYWAYYAHNLHFLAYSAMMEGRYETAITAARELERDMPEPFLREAAWLIEGIMPTTFHVMIRFGRWEEILQEPEPPDFRLVSRAVRYYARGIALSALGRTEEAREEIKAFDAAMAEVPQEWWIFNNRVHQVLPIARAMLAGELAFREGRLDEAYATLREGVAAEDALVYDEPPGWMLPVRHALGALFMSAGRYAEAEEIYREDQRRHRGNGWSLLGLKQALEAQGRAAEAGPIAEQLAMAWKRKDVKPTSSCYCEPRRS